MRPMIFGSKILRLDFFVTFFIKEKSKDYLQIKNNNNLSSTRPYIFTPENHSKTFSAGRRE
jgi:hypothetical protein